MMSKLSILAMFPAKPVAFVRYRPTFNRQNTKNFTTVRDDIVRLGEKYFPNGTGNNIVDKKSNIARL